MQYLAWHSGTRFKFVSRIMRLLNILLLVVVAGVVIRLAQDILHFELRLFILAVAGVIALYWAMRG